MEKQVDLGIGDLTNNKLTLEDLEKKLLEMKVASIDFGCEFDENSETWDARTYAIKNRRLKIVRFKISELERIVSEMRKKRNLIQDSEKRKIELEIFIQVVRERTPPGVYLGFWDEVNRRNLVGD